MGTYSLALATLLVSVTLACSPEGYRFNIPLEEMANKSPIIALATVTKTYPVSADNQSYYAELEVMCSYKGGPLPSIINITNAGSWPGMCGYRNFTVGLEYIVFLEDVGRSYSQRYDQTKPSMTSLNELLMFCGLTVEYPKDSNSSGLCIETGCKPPPPPPGQRHPAPLPPRLSHAKPPLFNSDPELGSTDEMPETSTMDTEGNYTMSVINETVTMEMETNETVTLEMEMTSTEGTTLPVTGGDGGEDSGQTKGGSSETRTVLTTLCLCVCTVLLSLS